MNSEIEISQACDGLLEPRDSRVHSANTQYYIGRGNDARWATLYVGGRRSDDDEIVAPFHSRKVRADSFGNVRIRSAAAASARQHIQCSITSNRRRDNRP